MKYLTIILLALISCRTTRNVQKFAKQMDSTGVVRKDSVRVIRTDSTAVGAAKVIHTTTDSADYEQWVYIEEDSAVTKTTIHIRDKGVRRSKVIVVSHDSTGLHKSDSATVQSAAVVRKITDESGKDIQVKKTQGGLWINLGIIVFVLLCLYLGYRKYKSKILNILGLWVISSCITPQSTIGLRDALPHVTPQQDTICIEESYDWYHHRQAIHIHCKHDNP